jgi:hypothetical protein
VNGSLLGFLGVALVGGAGIRWFRLIQQVRIPKDPTAYLVANGVGALLGIAHSRSGPAPSAASLPALRSSVA